MDKLGSDKDGPTKQVSKVHAVYSWRAIAKLMTKSINVALLMLIGMLKGLSC